MVTSGFSANKRNDFLPLLVELYEIVHQSDPDQKYYGLKNANRIICFRTYEEMQNQVQASYQLADLTHAQISKRCFVPKNCLK